MAITLISIYQDKILDHLEHPLAKLLRQEDSSHSNHGLKPEFEFLNCALSLFHATNYLHSFVVSAHVTHKLHSIAVFLSVLGLLASSWRIYLENVLLGYLRQWNRLGALLQWMLLWGLVDKQKVVRETTRASVKKFITKV